MNNYWKIANDVIKESNVIVLVGDARFPRESFNQEVYDKVKRSEKKFLFVLNKCDLTKDRKVPIEVPYLFVSAQEHLSTLKLYKKIRELSKGKEAIVGVLGYPNTGKSSLINAIRGKKSAPTSPQAGYTKGIQKIRVSRDIVLLDTPGVIPYQEKDESKHAFMASLSPNQVKDPEKVVFEIMDKYPGLIEKIFDVEVSEEKDYDATLEQIAFKKNVILAGRKADTKRVAKMILEDWQKGRIRTQHQ